MALPSNGPVKVPTFWISIIVAYKTIATASFITDSPNIIALMFLSAPKLENIASTDTGSVAAIKEPNAIDS